MYYEITVDSKGNITSQYAGPAFLPAPWISVTEAQYASIISGCSWSDAAIVAPSVPVFTSQQQLAQQAQALVAGGLTVTSTASPAALNGTYATDAQAQASMLGIVSYINANGKFPGSAETLTWYDLGGQAHVFSSTGEFMALYTAGLDFVMDCLLVADAGAGTLPETTATIP